MQTQPEHMNPLPDNGSGMSDVIGGFSQVTNGMHKYCAGLEAENQQLKAQLRALQQEQSNIVAKDKQKEWIAVLSVMFDKGLVVGCQKNEFMQRMATALGNPGIANYSGRLYNIKGTGKYTNILQNIKDIEQQIE